MKYTVQVETVESLPGTSCTVIVRGKVNGEPVLSALLDSKDLTRDAITDEMIKNYERALERNKRVALATQCIGTFEVDQPDHQGERA